MTQLSPAFQFVLKMERIAKTMNYDKLILYFQPPLVQTKPMQSDDSQIRTNLATDSKEQEALDIKWMRLALREAKKAKKYQEVPIGCVLVKDNQLVAKGYNLKESLPTPIGHAEIITLHRGAKRLKQWRLLDCTLYVTLEPCVMCAGALIQSRIKRLVFGAKDPKGGAITSLYQVANDPRLNHSIKFTEGVLSEECGLLLSSFFKEKRKK